MDQTYNTPAHIRSPLLGYLSLFTSFGTLLCCALPSLLVLVGLGATVASTLAAMPWLVTLSRHKNCVFLISGVLIGGNFAFTYVLTPRLSSERKACPVNAPDACEAATMMSRALLWISIAIYAVAAFSAYVLGPLLMRFGS
jgi:mercuric ion transport protein